MDTPPIKQVAWVFGVSSAGKETFIRDASTNPDVAMAFGWDPENIRVANSSIEVIGQFAGDPITERREQILSEVPALLLETDTVLVKWQFVDTESDRPARLANLCGQAAQSAIVVMTPIDELVERIVKKPWWKNITTPPEKYLRREVRLIESAVDSLPSNFSILRVSGAQSDNYAIIP